MRKKLIINITLLMFFVTTIISFISFNYLKKQIMDNTEGRFKEEAKLVVELIKSKEIKDYDNFATELKFIINKRITIIDSTGKVIGDSDVSSKNLENHKNRKEFIEAIEKGESFVLRKSSTLGKLLYYYALKYSLNGKIYVLRLSMDFNIINSSQDNYLHYFILTILFVLALAILLIYLSLNRIVEPIRDLTKVATKISMGSYDKRININTKDELGKLGHAFNRMAARLEETINDLEDKKNKLISILKSMGDGVIVFDINERIILINPTAKILFEIKEDVYGKHLLEVIRNKDIEYLIRENIEDEIEIKLNLTETKYYKIKTTRVLNTDKQYEKVGTLMVIQDITKMKMLENLRTEFVANVSHELKTPLTSIKGFAETLMDVEDENIRKKFLEIINIEADRLTRLINDILIISELENREYSINFEKINVIKSIEEVINIMSPVAHNKNIDLKFIKPSDEIYILGDRDKFKQMFINLIDNGIKYTNDGGFVEISMELERDNALVFVKDNGIGIPKEHLPRLFERFYRVDKARSRSLGGTGLGLAIVKHVVNLLNGKIDVYSKVGKGTTFTITLPIID
ncbi:Alkaline phosphatase synthesis sensor protein PhoR [Caloramator mitchellensis]|uniref:histidine kinase n=1 Tax=Caloramator mitchellensis TaxID=908809 RepID=A0A0R3JSW9_CALMK|nr:ATP-binding protein [Caloramator mitchellensis]KRQ86571.1 Alkaline phosphatase synthesis sensor protein PhoR [Caloramator mitchellensis]